MTGLALVADGPLVVDSTVALDRLWIRVRQGVVSRDRAVVEVLRLPLALTAVSARDLIDDFRPPSVQYDDAEHGVFVDLGARRRRAHAFAVLTAPPIPAPALPLAQVAGAGQTCGGIPRGAAGSAAGRLPRGRPRTLTLPTVRRARRRAHAARSLPGRAIDQFGALVRDTGIRPVAVLGLAVWLIALAGSALLVGSAP